MKCADPRMKALDVASDAPVAACNQAQTIDWHRKPQESSPVAASHTHPSHCHEYNFAGTRDVVASPVATSGRHSTGWSSARISNRRDLVNVSGDADDPWPHLKLFQLSLLPVRTLKATASCWWCVSNRMWCCCGCCVCCVLLLYVHLSATGQDSAPVALAADAAAYGPDWSVVLVACGCSARSHFRCHCHHCCCCSL